jgi:hypothetical protein
MVLAMPGIFLGFMRVECHGSVRFGQAVLFSSGAAILPEDGFE